MTKPIGPRGATITVEWPSSLLAALMQGPEAHCVLGVEICEAMWSPVVKTQCVTVEHLAILEPGLSEMVAMWTNARRVPASRARRRKIS